MKFVQSAIMSMSFPETLEGLFAAYQPQSEEEMEELADGWLTDIDLLHKIGPGELEEWTVPRWATPGDVLFLYHTKTAKKRIAKLLKEANRDLDADSNVVGLLEHARDNAAAYSGTIFACTELSAQPYYKVEKFEDQHFSGRVWGYIGNIHVFDNPLPSEEFADLVRIGQHMITTLDGTAFEGIRNRLRARNALPLPPFLENARFGGRSLREVNEDTWLSVVRDGEIGFFIEAQLRMSFLDHLLKEVKDFRSPLLRECECFRDEQKKMTGIADYFLKVHGSWVPLEGKLNVSVEKNLPEQLRQYISVDSFRPILNPRKGDWIKTPRQPICLVGDQSGIYLTRDGEFVDCSPEKPLWRREEFDESVAESIRERVGEEIAKSEAEEEQYRNSESKFASPEDDVGVGYYFDGEPVSPEEFSRLVSEKADRLRAEAEAKEDKSSDEK